MKIYYLLINNMNIGFSILILIGCVAIILSVCLSDRVVTTSSSKIAEPTTTLTLATSQSIQDRISGLSLSPKQWLDNLLRIQFNIPTNHILIGSGHCGEPLLLKAQYESIQHFCKFPFTFCVINDVKRHNFPDRYLEIETYCLTNNIIHIPFLEALHTQRDLLFPTTSEPTTNHPSTRTSDVVQTFLLIMQQHQGYALILDSDCVLGNFFQPEDILQNKYNYAAVRQSREHVTYIWNTVILFNMKIFPRPDLMTMDCGKVDGIPVDTGGQWHTYLQQTGNEPFWMRDLGGDAISKKFKETEPSATAMESFENIFLHYHNGGQWDPKSPDEHRRRTQAWYNFVREHILQKN